MVRGLLLKKAGEVRDSVHKYIEFTEVEWKIIDTPPVQRLRRIKQLAGANLTYASGEHTRFPHSLGVMHLSGRMAEKLHLDGFLEKDDIQKVRIAGLLHDLGHGPFSHMFEEVLTKYTDKTHEDLTRWIIKDTVVSDVIEDFGFSSEEIARLAVGKSNSNPLLNQIISGYFDADVMDYLTRDSINTGVEYGLFDLERLIDSLTVVDNRLAMDSAALYTLESFYFARYMMFKAVYFHRTVRSAGVMIAKAMDLSNCILGFTSFSEPKDFIKLDDYYVVYTILSSESKSKEIDMARELVNGFQNRRLLKAAFQVLLHHENPIYSSLLNRPSFRGELEEEIARIAGLDRNMVFMDVSTVPSLPYHPSSQGGLRGPEIPVLVKDEGSVRIESLFELSALARSLKGFVDVARIYTTAENKERVAAAARKVFGGQQPPSLRISL
jgi:HD superfamily phosphohydrolase